jgi:GR25 family glycosyltransferase involved in LPS biosynthesis
MAILKKDYMLVKISDNRKRTQENIKNYLNGFNRHETEFVNGFNIDEIKNFFIKNPEVKENRIKKVGEIGHWMTSFNIYKYIVNNNLDHLLILEDDAILSNTFIEDLSLCINELPENFEFFTAYQNIKSLYNCAYPKSQIMVRGPIKNYSNHNKKIIHPDWDIGSDLVVRTYQKHGTVAYIINKIGAQKMIDLIINNGFGMSRSYSSTIEQLLYLSSMNDIILGYQMSPYATINRLVTIEETIKNTDTESQIKDTPFLNLGQIWN